MKKKETRQETYRQNRKCLKELHTVCSNVNAILREPARIYQGFLCANHNEYLLCPCNARVYKISLQHYVVAHQHGHDHDRIFRVLYLMDGNCIGMKQFVQFRDIVLHQPAIKFTKLPILATSASIPIKIMIYFCPVIIADRQC